ncbi:MAG: hypothetical protein LBV17_10010 [Treponema sp.]|jgi:hypothetical protein|nr:hypothetical protein [Treponema sp.]
MNVKKLIWLFFIFFNSNYIFASYSDGYRFYFNNRKGSISIRYNSDTVQEYLIKADGLFFDLINWIKHNKIILENTVNDDIEIGIGPEKNVNIIEGSMGILGLDGNDFDKICKINKKIFEYKNYHELTQNIYKIIESYFDFSSVSIVNNSFELYFVWEKIGIHGYREGPHSQEENTEIFKGPFPGLMPNSEELGYGVVFWEFKGASKYLNKYIKESKYNLYIEKAIINKENILNYFLYYK